MTQFTFGAGVMYGVRTNVANSTPIPFGAVQEIQMDFELPKKFLWGQKAFPIAGASGKGKIECKSKFAQIIGRLFNELFFGQGTTAGGLILIEGEAGSGAIPTTPFQLTVTNTTGFNTDLGVWFTATSGGAVTTPLTKVASAPAAGQYSVSAAGVYTFNTADTGKFVKFWYTYNPTAQVLPAQLLAMPNPNMGIAPFFQLVCSNSQYDGKNMTFNFRKCVSQKLQINFKQEDFAIPEFDFALIDDGTGFLFDYATTE